jgi:hypothetical protein
MPNTKEQYKNAIRLALAAGNQEAAEELAEEAAVIYPEGFLDAPRQPPALTQKQRAEGSVQMLPSGYAAGVAERAKEFAPLDIVSQYPEEVSRRLETTRTEYGDMPTTVGLTMVSQAARTGGELVAGTANMLIPDAVREGFEKGWSTVKDLPGIRTLSEALSSGLEAYNETAKQNPKAAEMFETYIDVGIASAPQKALDLSKYAGKQQNLYNLQVREERKQGIEKLMDPHKTGEDGFDPNGFRGIGGPLDKTVYIPNQRDRAMRDAVESVERIDPNRSYAHAYTSVADEIERESKKLISMIEKQGNPQFQRQELLEDLRLSISNLKNDKEYRGTSAEIQKEVNRLAEEALKTIDANTSDALGLLQARKDFDEIVSLGKGQTLNLDQNTAKGIAGRYVRNVLNEKLKSITAGDVVHNSLDRSHNLYNAKSLFEKRRDGEATNRITMALQKISNVANLPSTPLALYATVKTGAAAAAGAVAGVGVGTGAVLGAAGGATIYTLLKAADRKTRLKYYSSLVSGIDKGIRAYQSDKNLVRELRADRAYIIYLMDQARQEEEQDG